LDIDRRLQRAVQSYWDARAKNKEKQVQSGKIDAGTRGEVTGGTQMGALEVLVADILCDAGMDKLDIRTRTALELPGYFRATKKWDLMVVSEGQLVMAMEFKSQAGKSIGSNVNNRAEEAVGSAKDIWTAYREGRFGKSLAPFLGYFFLLEDRPSVRTPVSNKEPYFPVDPVGGHGRLRFRGVRDSLLMAPKTGRVWADASGLLFAAAHCDYPDLYELCFAVAGRDCGRPGRTGVAGLRKRCSLNPGRGLYPREKTFRSRSGAARRLRRD
jgi:hypothetical protein